jgi:FkbM family methyltransferase
VRAARRVRNLTAHLRRLADEERIRSVAVTYGCLDYPRATVRLRVSSREEFHRLRSCSKEPWTVSWIEDYLRPGEVLYDVGANVGAYTLVAAVAVPGARIVAFEPGPANFAALCANVDLNELGEQVLPVPVALGERARAARRAGEGVAGAAGSLSGSGDGAAVLVDRLDDVVARFGLPAPNHLKLDVDGGELEVLEGASGLLASGTVRSAMVELDQAHERAVVDRLAGFGLELVARSVGQGRASDAPAYGLFARA